MVMSPSYANEISDFLCKNQFVVGGEFSIEKIEVEKSHLYKQYLVTYVVKSDKYQMFNEELIEKGAKYEIKQSLPECIVPLDKSKFSVLCPLTAEMIHPKQDKVVQGEAPVLFLHKGKPPPTPFEVDVSMGMDMIDVDLFQGVDSINKNLEELSKAFGGVGGLLNELNGELEHLGKAFDPGKHYAHKKNLDQLKSCLLDENPQIDYAEMEKKIASHMGISYEELLKKDPYLMSTPPKGFIENVMKTEEPHKSLQEKITGMDSGIIGAMSGSFAGFPFKFAYDKSKEVDMGSGFDEPISLSPKKTVKFKKGKNKESSDDGFSTNRALFKSLVDLYSVNMDAHDIADYVAKEGMDGHIYISVLSTGMKWMKTPLKEEDYLNDLFEDNVDVSHEMEVKQWLNDAIGLAFTEHSSKKEKDADIVLDQYGLIKDEDAVIEYEHQSSAHKGTEKKKSEIDKRKESVLQLAKKRLSLPVVSLGDDPQIYQQVVGTDTSSRYICVAKFANGYSLAVRYKTAMGILSVRFQGPDIKSVSGNLSAAGFEVKANHYASKHFSEVNSVQMRRVVSALVYGLDLPVMEVAPVLDSSILEGK